MNEVLKVIAPSKIGTAIETVVSDKNDDLKAIVNSEDKEQEEKFDSIKTLIAKELNNQNFDSECIDNALSGDAFTEILNGLFARPALANANNTPTETASDAIPAPAPNGTGGGIGFGMPKLGLGLGQAVKNWGNGLANEEDKIEGEKGPLMAVKLGADHLEELVNDYKVGGPNSTEDKAKMMDLLGTLRENLAESNNLSDNKRTSSVLENDPRKKAHLDSTLKNIKETMDKTQSNMTEKKLTDEAKELEKAQKSLEKLIRAISRFFTNIINAVTGKKAVLAPAA